MVYTLGNNGYAPAADGIGRLNGMIAIEDANRSESRGEYETLDEAERRLAKLKAGPNRRCSWAERAPTWPK